MTAGGFLGLVTLKMTTVLHGALATYVSVTNVAGGDGDNHLRFTLLPAGLALTEWAADMVETYVGLLSLLAVVPRLGEDLAKVFTVLLS